MRDLITELNVGAFYSHNLVWKCSTHTA